MTPKNTVCQIACDGTSPRPFVTVLMSVYNGEKWLAEAITSVLAQTYDDYEFIIINDGSTDRSLNIANTFAERDARIRILDKQKTGLTHSLNIGLNEANGQWIARIDADDLFLPKKLEKQVAYIRQRPRLVLIGTAMNVVDQRGYRGKTYSCPTNHSALSKRLTRGSAFFSHSSAMFRTAVAQTLGGYKLRLQRSQDRDLWLRLLERGKIGCLSLPLTSVRHHDRQVSHEEAGARQIVDAYIAMTSYYLRKMGLPDPITADADEDYYEFKAWITGRLKASRVLDLSSYVRTAKADLDLTRSRPQKILKAITYARLHPLLTWDWLLLRHNGSRLPRNLARSWKKETAS